MPTRLLSILVIVAVISGCGASAEQIEAARLRIRVLASCLDEVAEGIGTGAFEPKYAECIDILGRNDGQGFRELQAADMRVAVMDLLSERETAFRPSGVRRAGGRCGQEELHEEVTALAGERYARKDPSVARHGSNPGTVSAWIQACPGCVMSRGANFPCGRTRRCMVSRRSEADED